MPEAASCSVVLAALLLNVGEHAVGLQATVASAGKSRGPFRTEQAFIGAVGDPGLAFGRALRRPWRQPDLAHGFGHLADLFAAAPAMFDHALEEIGALLFPIDARKGLLERCQHRILDAVAARG